MKTYRYLKDNKGVCEQSYTHNLDDLDKINQSLSMGFTPYRPHDFARCQGHMLGGILHINSISSSINPHFPNQLTENYL